MNEMYHCYPMAWVPNSPPNMIKIGCLTCFHLLICCCVGDLRKPQHVSYASDLMSWIYKDMINTLMTLFGQSDYSWHAKQISSTFAILIGWYLGSLPCDLPSGFFRHIVYIDTYIVYVKTSL
jgi:hypothetical protein